jgi:hypothetical protein
MLVYLFDNFFEFDAQSEVPSTFLKGRLSIRAVASSHIAPALHNLQSGAVERKFTGPHLHTAYIGQWLSLRYGDMHPDIFDLLLHCGM